MASKDSITLQQIIQIEPRVGVLLRLARSTHGRKSHWFCANEVWYELYKPRLEKLVGWEAEIDALESSEAYGVACEAIYRSLPGCRNCACIAFEESLGIREPRVWRPITLTPDEAAAINRDVIWINTRAIRRGLDRQSGMSMEEMFDEIMKAVCDGTLRNGDKARIDPPDEMEIANGNNNG